VSSRQAAKRRRNAGQAQSGDCVVTVCRGCCCGTMAKHPDVHHAGQLAALRGGVADSGRVRVSDCLDACQHSNVIVVTPSPAGREAGARPVWLGEVLDEDTTAEVAAWVTSGGPGLAEPPGALDLHVFSPSRRVRQAAER
jgi:(2Fe-2S) ferredoxin